MMDMEARIALKVPRSHFIVGPTYDVVLFVLSPLIALGLGVFLSVTEPEWRFGGDDSAIVSTLLGVFVHAHLFIVIFRSHANPEIRKLYPRRFFVVPPILLVGMLTSEWFLVSVSVLATFWDVYHSALQTFGLGRIYDIRAGNNPKTARTLDAILNHLLYAGPILAGATMTDHFEDFYEFDDVGALFFHSVPAFMESSQRYLAWGLLLFGSTFLVYYVATYVRLMRRGYHVSLPKVVLFAATGFCSIYTWGFNTWGEAFFIMNFFHALQYFAIVWYKEQGNMTRLFRTSSLRWYKPITLSLFVGAALGYGTLVEWTPTSAPLVYPLSLVVAIMHFWYDGFIWSVQRKQV